MFGVFFFFVAHSSIADVLKRGKHFVLCDLIPAGGLFA